MTNIAKRVLLIVLAGGVFLFVAMGLVLLAGWMEWMPPELPEAAVPVFVIAILGVPTVAALLVGRVLASRWRLPAPGAASLRTKRTVWALGSMYLITAIAGVPAVQSEQTSWAVSEYKQLKASGSARVWDNHPYIRSYAAIPVAPGLILSYHEYQLDGLYGFGGFEVSLWYGIRVKSLGTVPLWVS